MVTNIITSLKGTERVNEREVGDLSQTTRFRGERKRERGQTVLLTGLALALAACEGGGSSGGGGTPTQWASLAISEGADTGTAGDRVTNAAEVMLSVGQAPEGAVVRITRDGTQVGELIGLTAVSQGFESSFASGIGEGQTGTFVATVLASATDDTVISEGDYTFTVDRQSPQAPTITMGLGTVNVPLVREEITQVEGTGEAGASVRVKLGEELLGEAKVGENGTWVVTLDEAARARFTAGENVLRIEQEDVAGNVSEQRTQSLHVEVEEANRVARLSLISDTGVTGDGITNGETVVLGVSAVEGKMLPTEAMVRIARNGVPVGELSELTAVPQGFETSFASGIGEGQTGTFVATVVASRTDDTVLSQGYEFTVDRQPPEEVMVVTELGTMEAPVARRTITQIEGTGEEGANVQVKLGEELLGEARVGEEGTWVVMLDEAARDRFTVGENVLRIGQEDVAGNVSGQRAQKVYLDEDLEIEIVLVSDTGVEGDGITNGETVVLGVSAVEGKTLPTESVVRITRDGEVIHEGLALTGNEGEFRVNVNTQVLEGQTGTFVATVVASATDNTVLSRGYEFTVDRQPPEEVTVVTELGTMEAPVARRTITQVEGTGEAGANVQVRLGEELLGEARVGEDGTWVVRLDEAARARFTVGENVLGIEQEDGAGNVSESVQWVVVVKDDPQPTASIRLSEASDQGSANNDGITLFADVDLEVMALGDDLDLGEAVVQITQEGVVVATLAMNGETSVEFSSSVNSGEEGTFVVRVLASATDDTPLSATYEFTVDRQFPDAPTITTQNVGTQEDPLFRSEVLRFEGTGEAEGTVNLFIQSVRSAEAAIGENGRWVMELDEAVRDRLQVGENTLRFGQEDVAGNSGLSRFVTVWVKENAPVEVRMENDTGVQGDGITNEQTVALVLNPAQGAPDLTNAVVQITKDGAVIHEGLALTNSAGEFQVSVNTQVLEGQTGTFVARLLTSATDDTLLGVRYEFTVDRESPQAPTITTENLGTVEAPVFRSAVLGIVGTGEAGVRVKVNLGDQELARTEVRKDGTFVVVWDQEARDRLSEGLNTLKIVQEDGAGNVSEGVDWVVVVKDDPQPTASIRLAEGLDSGASNSDGITAYNNVSLEVTSQGGDLGEAVVQITKEGVVVQNLELNEATLIEFFSGIEFRQEGTFVARVLASATDDTPLSAAYEFTVDQQNPHPPTITTENLGTQEDHLFRSEVLRFEGAGEARGTVKLIVPGFQNISVPIGEGGMWVLELDEAVRNGLQIGENTLNFVQEDVAGNEGSVRSMTVWVKEDASIEVKIENDTGVQGDSITNAQVVALVFIPAQGAPDLTNAVVQITKDGEVIHEELALTSNAGELQVNVNTQVPHGQTGTFVARLLTSATDDTLLGVRYEFTVDRQTPEAPTITTENLGTVEDPLFRSEVPLRFEGTGEAGGSVILYQLISQSVPSLLASISIREDGRWVMDLAEAVQDRLRVGENTLYFRQEDVAGNEGMPRIVKVWVKKNAVEVRMENDTGVQGDDITNEQTVALVFNPVQGAPDLTNAMVQITKDGEVIHEGLALTNSAGEFRVSVNTQVLDGQTGMFVARLLTSATDDTLLIVRYEFTVDRQIPEAPTIATENLGTVGAPVFRSEVLGITGTGEAGVMVKVRLGDEAIAQAEVRNNGTFWVALDQEAQSQLSEGLNTLGIVQEGVAGNVSEGVDWVVVVKNDPQPTASIKLAEASDRGSSNSDGITAHSTVSLEVIAQGGGELDLSEAVVQITKEGVVVATLELNGATRVEFSSGIAFNQEGTFVARVLASATDNTPLSAAYEFTLDQLPPDPLSFTIQNVGTQEDPLFRSEVRIEGTGEAGGTVLLIVSGFPNLFFVPIRENGTWVLEMNEAMRDRLKVGETELLFRGQDVAGNTGEFRTVRVWVKEDGSAVEMMGNTEEVFVEAEHAQEYAEILGVNNGEDTFYG